MARGTRSSKPAPALSSPPAGRTRSKLKEKDAAAHNNNNTASSSSKSTTDAPAAAPAQKAPGTKKTAGKTKSAANTKATMHDNTAAPSHTTTSSSQATAPAVTRASHKDDMITSEDPDTNAPAPRAANKRSRRQPAVDRKTTKVTKSRTRKPTTKTSATTKNAIEQHIQQENAAPTPAPPAPVRRTRATLKAGIASPLLPVTDAVTDTRKSRPKRKISKDATPLSILKDGDKPTDPDDWFADVQQEPRIYRDPGASMEEISEREEAGNNEAAEHDTASSDADENMGDDIEMVTDVEMLDNANVHAEDEDTENGGSETEEDLTDDETADPQVPAEDHRPAEAHTTARSFGFASLLSFNPLASVRKLWARTPALEESQSPSIMSPESPSVASPSRAAQARRNRNRKAQHAPREKDADKRHEMAEKNQEKHDSQQLEAELRERDRQIAQSSRDAEQQKLQEQREAQQIPGQKRRRPSPDVIPARRPGEKGSYGMLDEFFSYEEEPSPDSHRLRAKRRRLDEPASTGEETDDSGYDFVQLPTEPTPPSLKRPRNGVRMAAMKDGQEDPMVANHELRVMHQENSFSHGGVASDKSPVNVSSQTKKSSPSAVYNGSFMAMPGDSGYRAENVFKMSDQQLQEERPRSKDGKMDPAELKARAEEIVTKEKNGQDITDEEREILEKAQRKFGHIAGSGSFSAPEYDSDDDTIMSDEMESTSPPQQTPPSAKASPTKVHSTRSSTSNGPAINQSMSQTGTTKDSSPKESASKDTVSTDKSDSTKPPPPPTPAHAQLPSSTSATPDSAMTKTTASTLGSSAPKGVHSAALARQRELAEKHKPKTGSRLQFVSGISGSAGAPPSPIMENTMESSLITQGMSTPASNVGASSLGGCEGLTKMADMDLAGINKLLNPEEKNFFEWMLEKKAEEIKDLRKERFELFELQLEELKGCGESRSSGAAEVPAKGPFAKFERELAEARGL